MKCNLAIPKTSLCISVSLSNSVAWFSAKSASSAGDKQHSLQPENAPHSPFANSTFTILLKVAKFLHPFLQPTIIYARWPYYLYTVISNDNIQNPQYPKEARFESIPMKLFDLWKPCNPGFFFFRYLPQMKCKYHRVSQRLTQSYTKIF